ncbi:MAG: hypothetical protein JOZ68_07060 [Acidimicrobiia bacterium]|nr:hypothetical protein [Acidimicrobiia bacterium]
MKRFIVAAAVALMGLALWPATAAVAQTSGYPPPPNCTNNPTAQNLGTIAVGDTLDATLTPVCIFISGSTVNMTVNGANGGTKTANSNGGVHISLFAASSTSGSLNDPVTVPIQCGTNTITASGNSATGPTSTTGIFTLTCPAAAATTASPSKVAFTGANILRWSLGALALIGIGTLFVLGSRRRREAH